MDNYINNLEKIKIKKKIQEAQKNVNIYFKNLTRYLEGNEMILLSKCGIPVNIYKKTLFNYLCVLSNSKTVQSGFNSLKESLLPSPIINSPYYHLTDGYLHDQNFNAENLGYMLESYISDSFTMFTELKNLPIKFDYNEFLNFSITQIKGFLKEYDLEDIELSSYEFAEIIFAKALLANLSYEITIEKFLKNK